ncbi:hypothetical protein EW146_g9075, partial [Bondarzewia mesenterica]
MSPSSLSLPRLLPPLARMSCSVDDLVNSFNSNHIGQEAIDLALLHAQLAQTLFGQSTPSPNAQSFPRRSAIPPRCNTPTARTPSSSSFHWDDTHRRRSSSIAMDDLREVDLDDMEDERMVEDLLGASASSPAPLRVCAQPISPPPSH